MVFIKIHLLTHLTTPNPTHSIFYVLGPDQSFLCESFHSMLLLAGMSLSCSLRIHFLPECPVYFFELIVFFSLLRINLHKNYLVIIWYHINYTLSAIYLRECLTRHGRMSCLGRTRSGQSCPWSVAGCSRGSVGTTGSREPRGPGTGRYLGNTTNKIKMLATYL